MIRTASKDSGSGSDAVQAWRNELDQWRTAAERCVSDAVAEMRQLIESIELLIQQETAARAERATPTSPSLAAASMNSSAGMTQSVPVTNAVYPPDRNIAPGFVAPAAAEPRTRVAGRGDDASAHRLAELARRLEEKLGTADRRRLER
jgi:hypothetical protein